MSLDESLELARAAAATWSWSEALALLKPQARDLAAGEDLVLLGKAADSCGDNALAIDAWERAVDAFDRAGDRAAAAEVALMIRHLCANHLMDSAAARGWIRRASELLADLPECPQHGMLLRAQGRRTWMDGQREQGLGLLDEAIAIARRQGDVSTLGLSLSWKALCLIHQGDVAEGLALIDESAAMAAAGSLGRFATGVVFCNAISAYRDIAEFSQAGEWTETARRWCARREVGAFPGVCRVHRAEIMRLRGAWTEAAAEAERAAGELDGVAIGFAGDAYYELAEVRLRMGDAAGAEAALKLARERGSNCQPARSLLLRAAGEVQAAWHALRTALDDDLSPLDRARMLPLRVELAVELGLLDDAGEAVAMMQGLARDFPSAPMRAMAAQCEGTLELARGGASPVSGLRSAVRLWNESNLPYEAASARLVLARALETAGDRVGAADELEAARSVFDRLGAHSDAAGAGALQARLRQAPTSAVSRCLLFTDIVGSTALVEAIGDQAWAQLLSWHDETLRRLFAAHGGEEVDHAGDGFFVAFPEAAGAVECGLSIQRTLATHRRDHGFAPQVRIGVHLAQVSPSGRGYRGSGVHLSARLAAAAAGGEVLASQETLTAAGVAAADLRSLQLKGLAKPVLAGVLTG